MPPFVLRVGLRSCLARPPTFLRSFNAGSLADSKRNTVRYLTSVPYVGARHASRSLWLLTTTSIAGAALGVSSLAWTSLSTLHCDDASHSQARPSLPPPPKSSVNAYELTFGTVCGVCAGVFVKKSARMVAFFFGGLFVVLQYLGSLSLVKVDWAGTASRFENLFYTTDAVGNRKPPTVRSIWKWVVDFLTADFQPRASFVVGFALGLRVG